MNLHLVNDGVPPISISIIEEACSTRNISCSIHNAGAFVFAPEIKAAPGDLLFRPAISANALKVEQFLYRDGVATFYKDTNGIFFNCNNANAMFEAAGIPTPRSFYLNRTTRDTLDYYVEQLGGYPVVLKVPGHSGGVGVMKLDSQQALYSVVDFVSMSGQLHILSAFVDGATHWRCVVVGEQVVASYINPPDGNDFRTYGTTNPEEVFSSIDAEIESLAIQAVHALGVYFGGVDILQHPSGRLYVLEANFPCYYAHAQEVGGIDVAGRMVDFLLARSKSF